MSFYEVQITGTCLQQKCYGPARSHWKSIPAQAGFKLRVVAQPPGGFEALLPGDGFSSCRAGLQLRRIWVTVGVGAKKTLKKAYVGVLPSRRRAFLSRMAIGWWRVCQRIRPSSGRPSPATRLLGLEFGGRPESAPRIPANPCGSPDRLLRLRSGAPPSRHHKQQHSRFTLESGTLPT